MKKLITIISAVFMTAIVFAQAPQKMSYQAVIRNTSNALVTNTQVGMQIRILQGSATGTVVYTETTTPTTNANGLVSIEIGGGAGFNTIDWANGPYFIKTETDPTGGTSYSISGTSQLLSVPYALHAKTAESIIGGINEMDPVFNGSPASGITSNDITNWNNKLSTEVDSSVTNEIQALSRSNDTIYLSNGGFVKLPAGFDGNYNSLTNKPTTVSSFTNDAGYLTTEKDSSVTNEIQALSRSNDTIYLSNGGFVKLPAGFDGNYNSLTNKPTAVSSFTNDAGYLTTEVDGSITNEIQALSRSNDTIYLSNGGFVKLPAGFDGNYNSLANKPTTVSSFTNDAGYLTTEVDGSITNEIQALSRSNDTIYLSNGGFVKLPAGFDGNYNSLTNKPTTVSSFTNDAGYLTNEIDGSITNEIQALSISNDTISLSNGGFVRLPNGLSSVNIINDSLYVTFAQGQVTNAGYVGNGSPGSSLPTVTTVNITDVNYYDAKANATITNNGNEFILSRGVCLSTNPTPDLNDTIYVNGVGTGSFAVNCTDLLPNTTYYVRAFATNTVGTSYGNELSFTTKTLTTPTLTTQVVSNITNTTAISGGNITENGGSPILQRGICYALHTAPTLTDSIRSQGAGMGNYIALMTGLTGGTTYYVRAYATNAQGTTYGNELSFTTIVYSLATITTTAMSNVSYTTATSGGTVSNDNGSPVTSRGVCWATTTNPTTANSNYTEAGGLGTFTANVTGLTTNTTYYLRAFAINGGGTSYGNQVTFTTLASAAPILTTKSVTGISSNNAGSGGNITSDGGLAITAKGICWSLNANPTTANSKTTDGTGIASYNSTMNGLNPLTSYYVRAYATNALGTSYGNELSFSTTDLVSGPATPPTVGTSPATLITSTTAKGGGFISYDGGSPILVKGLCWGTSPNPTLANSFSSTSSTAIGYFNDTVTGISGCGVVYYIRAYATNSIGTSYGNQVTVTSGLAAQIATDSITSISYTTAVCGGNIVDDGGCPVTARGVCWSYTPNPTIGNFHTADGTGTGAFVSNMTGLFANQTYYVRAYVTNNTGTTYGTEKVFTTATPSTPYIGQNYAGGIIFYIDGSGEHGYVCAPTDQPYAPWGCEGTFVGTNTAFGTGAANTATILAVCNTVGTAAYVCDTLTLNSYNDWFLPSRDELQLMYTNLSIRGIGSFTYTIYWSSSQVNGGYSFCFYFNYGVSDDDKHRSMNVRAIRAF